MTRQDLINEINGLLIANGVGFLIVNKSRATFELLNKFLNNFKKQTFYKTPLIAMLYTIPNYIEILRIKRRND